jgi:hypothetical protein
MQHSKDIWINLLGDNGPGRIDKLQGLLALKSDFDASVFFNNVGVVYEKFGEYSLAKVFYIKSLGENLLGGQVWKNLSDLINRTNFYEENSFYLLLYFLQSSFALNIYLMIFMSISIYLSVKLFKKQIGLGSVAKILTPFFIFICIILQVNNKNFFYLLKSDTETFYGPSSVFQKDNGNSLENLVIKIKSSNNFVKVYDQRSIHSVYWVNEKTLIGI